MKKVLLALFMFFLLVNLFSQQEMPLYDGPIPNSKPATDEEKSSTTSQGMFIIEGIQKPTITVYLPSKELANGAAVIICPGGGYHIVAARHEGEEVAREFNKWGVTAFVLKYRMPDDKWMMDRSTGPLQDGQRAVQLVRTNAAKWNIDPARIGIMGFSAGGHLASSIATHFRESLIVNPVNTSLRPGFQILIYPVISFSDSIGHTGSRDNLIGKQPTPAKIDWFSGEKNITVDAPPAFLVHATDDNVVKVQNSLWYANALLAKNVAVEMHIYEKGGHGYGLHNKTTKDEWMDRLHNWMESKGWLKR
jgi:acetyl esterase/lipase